MLLEKHRFAGIVSFLLIIFFSFGCGEKKSDDQNSNGSTEKTSSGTSELASVDVGLPIYPNAEQDPENPPIKTPHMQNLKLLTDDSFEEVVKWYTEKLGKFQINTQKKGSQALWRKEAGGSVQAATISTILAPEGKTAITLVKGNLRR
jgi:hypothetical protein